MYLLKTIYFDNLTQQVSVENGIRVTDYREMIPTDPFWGKTQLTIGNHADFSKFQKVEGENYILLSYVNDYCDEKIEDSFKKLYLYVDNYDEKNVDGYIIFMRHEEDISTDGTRIFTRYPYELVVSLSEGQYLNFSGRRIEVINGKLMLAI